jgi:hypothetical protein
MKANTLPLVIILAVTTALAADIMPPEAKQEFSNRVQQLLGNMKTVAEKVGSGIQDGSISDFSKDKLAELTSGAANLASKFTQMQASPDDKYAEAKDQVQKAADKIENVYYQAAGKLKDMRDLEQKQVTESLGRLGERVATLQQNAAANPAVSQTAASLKKNEDQVRSKLDEMKVASGKKWTDLRQQIDNLMQKANESYWDTVKNEKAG